MIAVNKVQGSINGLSVSAVLVWVIYYRILKDPFCQLSGFFFQIRYIKSIKNKQFASESGEKIYHNLIKLQ